MSSKTHLKKSVPTTRKVKEVVVIEKTLTTKISVSKNLLINKYATNRGDVKEVWKAKEMVLSTTMNGDFDIAKLDNTHTTEIRKAINSFFAKDGPDSPESPKEPTAVEEEVSPSN